MAPPVVVVGDIHGFYRDLVNIFSKLGPPGRAGLNKKTGQTQWGRYLFLGDYVDRGEQSIEVITLLLTYKVLYPDHFFLLRGNHEVERINQAYGFHKECTGSQLGPQEGERLYKLFNGVFDELPVAALIGGRILGMHGGLSPYLESVEQLRSYPKPIRNPTQGLVNDILWSDPEVEIRGWQPSPRRTSFIFGADVVKRFCEQLDLDLIVRAHQCCQDGLRFFADRRLVTIFSAPMYCPIVKNSGAVMRVDGNLCISFVFFTPPPRRMAKAQSSSRSGGQTQASATAASAPTPASSADVSAATQQPASASKPLRS